MSKLALLTFIFACMTILIFAQTSGELYKNIAEIDSLYFTAQNDCNLEKYKSFLDADFEFYHDKAGMTKSRESEMEGMQIFCGEQHQRQPLRRELIKGTLKVYPLDNFGALETCEHVFYLQIKGGQEKLVAKAKFTCIWKLEDSTWKISRIISYDHQPIGQIKLSLETLIQYEGNYQATDRVVNIKRENNILRVTDFQNGKAEWNAELLPEAKNIFYLNYENVQYKFVTEGAKVVKMLIFENGKKPEEAIRIK
jgi:hypothetical protein